MSNRGSWYILATNDEMKCFLFGTPTGRGFGSPASAERMIKKMQDSDYRYARLNMIVLPVNPALGG